jgi:2-oxoglutarate ferredoxin oxidoreductase subunit delta
LYLYIVYFRRKNAFIIGVFVPKCPTGRNIERENSVKKGKIRIDADRCKGCLVCIEQCPKKEIAVCDTINKFGYNIVEFRDCGACNACTLCAIVCPDAAIEVIELIDEAVKR